MQAKTTSFSVKETPQQQEIGLALARIVLEAAREGGHGVAAAFGGSHLTFSQVLAAELEKNRRLQQLKTAPQEAMRKAPPLPTA